MLPLVTQALSDSLRPAIDQAHTVSANIADAFEHIEVRIDGAATPIPDEVRGAVVAPVAGAVLAPLAARTADVPSQVITPIADAVAGVLQIRVNAEKRPMSSPKPR